jgi:hypothetical protein
MCACVSSYICMYICKFICVIFLLTHSYALLFNLLCPVFPKDVLADCSYPRAMHPPYALLSLIRSEEDEKLQTSYTEQEMLELKAVNKKLCEGVAGVVTGDPFIHDIYEIANELLPVHEKRRLDRIRRAKRAERDADKNQKKKQSQNGGKKKNTAVVESKGKATAKQKVVLSAAAKAIVLKRREQEDLERKNEEEEREARWKKLKELCAEDEAARARVAAASAADAAAAAAADQGNAEEELDVDAAEEEELLKRQVEVAETEQQKILRETRMIIQERMHKATGAVQKKYPVLPAHESGQLDRRLSIADKKRRQTKACKTMSARRETLPAHTMRQEVLDTINNNRVLVISGETGCGKSTQVPQFILENFISEQSKGSKVNVIVTQPRRIAAIALAERVSEERAQKCGSQVGYSIRLESQFSAQTQLLFCTTGILLRRLERWVDCVR